MVLQTERRRGLFQRPIVKLPRRVQPVDRIYRDKGAGVRFGRTGHIRCADQLGQDLRRMHHHIVINMTFRPLFGDNRHRAVREGNPVDRDRAADLGVLHPFFRQPADRVGVNAGDGFACFGSVALGMVFQTLECGAAFFPFDQILPFKCNLFESWKIKRSGCVGFGIPNHRFAEFQAPHRIGQLVGGPQIAA